MAQALASGKPGYVFTLSRVVNAPIAKAWAAWTQNDNLKQWFGPKGWPILKTSLQLAPGGSYHYCLGMPGGAELWGKWVFEEIIPETRLVYAASFSDAEGNVTRNPWSDSWPLIMHSVVRFKPVGADKTEITLEATAENASEAEQKTFEEGNASMRGGWGGTFDQLESFLTK